MKRIHFISGLIISIFIAAHLFNHFFSVFGIERHIQLMESLRLVYRNPLIETVLLLAVLTQIISGLKLFFAKKKTSHSFFEKLHIWSGLYLAFFLTIHVSAVLAGRLVLNLDTNFYFGAAGLNTFPFNLFFIPYYSLGIIAFFGHIAAIHQQKMKFNILGMSPSLQANLILIKGVILTIIIIYGLTNSFSGIEIPEAYNVLIGK